MTVMPPPTPSNPCPERPSRRGRMRKRKCVANAILSAGKPLHVTSASLKMRARAGLVQAALVGELPLELSARGRGAYAGLHAVFRLRREARELGLSGLRLLPGRALLCLGHTYLRKILLIGGADPVVQVPPAEFALGLQIADGRPE
jgi:hypothetical protein